MAEVTYYFNSKSTSVWTDSAYMIDGILTNYAYTSSTGDIEGLDGNDSVGTDLGTITDAEVRVYGYGDGNDRIDLVVMDSGVPLQTVQNTMPAEAGWSAYTSFATSWVSHLFRIPVFTDVPNLDCSVKFTKVAGGGTMYCAKVEIRVTYEEGAPSAGIGAYAQILNPWGINKYGARIG